MPSVTMDYGIGRPEQQEWDASPDCPERGRWRQITYQGSEVETLHWLTATVALLKPRTVVESGTHLGHGSAALAIGLALCNEGHLWTVESEQELADHARAWLADQNFGKYTTVICSDDIAAVCREIDLRPELYWCDSYSPETASRADEIRRMIPLMAPGGIILAHDTEPHWSDYRAAVRAIADDGLVDIVDLPTPRGLTIMRVHGSNGRAGLVG